MTIRIDRASTISRALVILQDRGWSKMWSTSDDSPLNIRSAVAKACTQLIGMSDAVAWYEAYLDAVHALSFCLKKGITEWENSVKSPAQVEAMLNEVINRLMEADDIPTRRSTRPRHSGV